MEVGGVELAALLTARSGWWEAARLERLLGGGGKRIGYGADAAHGEYAFLCADYPSGRRAAVALELGGQRVMALFELGGTIAIRGGASTLASTVLGGGIVMIVRRAAAPAVEVEEVSSVELSGARVADRVVLLHSEAHTWRSPVSFTVKGSGPLKHLIVGLAPGTWEIWLDGWLVEAETAVSPETRALRFERPAGSYFLRRFG